MKSSRGFWAGAVLVLVILVGLGYFFFYQPYEQNLAYQLKETCAQNGAKWVASAFPNDASFINNKEYVYSPQLNTCLAYIQFAYGPFDHGGYGSLEDEIYDVYGNQKLDDSTSDIGSTNSPQFQEKWSKYFPDIGQFQQG